MGPKAGLSVTVKGTVLVPLASNCILVIMPVACHFTDFCFIADVNFHRCLYPTAVIHHATSSHCHNGQKVLAKKLISFKFLLSLLLFES